MNGGFSFCGMDIAQLGIYYTPELSDTFVYKNANQSQHEEAFTAHTGGIYYGSNAQAKEFTLRCYFENNHANKGIVDNVMNFFYNGRTGRLIFEKRDWCWYNATVMGVEPELTNYMNGFITIKMKAYYPFARTNIKSVVSNGIDGLHDLFQYNTVDGKIIIGEDILPGDSYIHFWADKEDILAEESYVEFWTDNGERDINAAHSSKVQTMDNTYLAWDNIDVFTSDPEIEEKAFFMENSQMPVTYFSNITGNTNILLYNAGNEYAAVGVRIKGNAGANGIVIKNNSTNQEMKVVAFARSVTTNVGKAIYIDGINAKTTLIDGTSSELALVYHDHGYLSLKPARPEFRKVVFNTTAGSNIVRCKPGLIDSCIGKYVCLGTTWYKIVEVLNNRTVRLDKAVNVTQQFISNVADMNEISIITSNGSAIDEIEFIYKHTFR